MAGIGEHAREHQVAVEDGAGAVGNRVLLVIPLGQNGVEGGDRTATIRAVTGAFDQLRQTGKNRRRIAARHRRLADSQRDFALCHGVAGQRVHDQQHVLALIAEIFGDGGGVGRPLQAHQRADIGGRSDDDRTAQALLAEDLFDEFLDLATAFADQSDDDDLRRGVARHHAEQDAFADAGTGKEAHALATPDGQEGIDGTHANIERMVDRCPQHRIDRPSLQGAQGFGIQGAVPVERPPGPVNDAAEQIVADRQQFGSVDRATSGRWGLAEFRRTGAALLGNDPRPRRQAVDVFRRHQKQPFAVEADDFGLDRRTAAWQDQAGAAERQLEPGRLHHQPVDARQMTAGENRLGMAGCFPTVLEKILPASEAGIVAHGRLMACLPATLP